MDQTGMIKDKKWADYSSMPFDPNALPHEVYIHINIGI